MSETSSFQSRVEMPIQKPSAESYRYTRYEGNTGLQKKSYRIIIDHEDGRSIVTCLDLQGVVTDGATDEEAMENVRDAIETMLEARGLPIEEFNLIPIVIL